MFSGDVVKIATVVLCGVICITVVVGGVASWFCICQNAFPCRLVRWCCARRRDDGYCPSVWECLNECRRELTRAEPGTTLDENLWDPDAHDDDNRLLLSADL